MSWVTIAVVSIGSTLAGAAVSIQGQRNAAKSQEYANDYNADQARKQAKYDESIAQENMRRTRANNKRELARRRATNARGGLAETGAVTASLVETDKILQQSVDDIWDRAAMNSSVLDAKANMFEWQGDTASQAAKTNMWATGIGAVGSAASQAMKFGGGVGGKEKAAGTQDVWSQPGTGSTRNYRASL